MKCLTAFPGRSVERGPNRVETHEMLVEGDKVGGRVTISGRNTGKMFGLPATGSEVKMMGLVFFRLVGDKIAEQWMYHA